MPYIITSTIALGISYSIFLFFLKKEKSFQFNRIFLLGSLVLCLLAPILELDFGNNFSRVPIMEVREMVSTKIIPQEIIIGQTVETFEPRTDFSQILFFIYLTISGLFMLRFGRNIFSIINFVKNGETKKLQGLSLVAIREKDSPYSFFHYLFANQTDLENNTISEAVLAHEKAHAVQFHSVDVVFIELLTCFFWFNPFVWLYKKAVVENHEFLADEEVMRSGIDRDFYSGKLVRTGNNSQYHNLISGFNFSQTKNRITMLYKKRSSKTILTLKTGMVLGLFAVMFAFLACTSDKANAEAFVVVVDAGHGGEDAGVLNEKTINLQIAKKLAALSREDKVKIILIREKDEFLSLNHRVEFTKNQNADLFLSLHCNSSKNKKDNGIVVFYSNENKFQDTSRSYGEIIIVNYLNSLDNCEVKGNLKTANFLVLRELNIPGVMVEMGFLTNEKEAKQLQNPDHQQKIAENLYESLLEIAESR